MSNRLVHVVTGSAAGTILALVQSAGQPEPARICEVFGGFVGGYAGGRLPDILDPALTPRHRGRAHSVLVGATGIELWRSDLDRLQERCRDWAAYCAARQTAAGPGSVAAILFAFAEAICRMLAGFIAGIIAGYLTHLALDARTNHCINLV